MGYYKTHIIQKPENLQMIATMELKDTTRWYELATLNNLVYPYIVPTSQEKLANPDHLLTYGDRISLPTVNQLADMLQDPDDYAVNNPFLNKDSVYDDTLGMDLKMTMANANPLDDQIAWLTQLRPGYTQIAKVSGLNNLKQALAFRLLTRYGTLPLHPKYGSRMLDMVGEKLDKTSLSLISTEILRTIRTDTRVDDVKVTSMSIPDGRSFYMAFTVSPINIQDAFNLYVQRLSSGQPTIF